MADVSRSSRRDAASARRNRSVTAHSDDASACSFRARGFRMRRRIVPPPLFAAADGAASRANKTGLDVADVGVGVGVGVAAAATVAVGEPLSLPANENDASDAAPGVSTEDADDTDDDGARGPRRFATAPRGSGDGVAGAGSSSPRPRVDATARIASFATCLPNFPLPGGASSAGDAVVSSPAMRRASTTHSAAAEGVSATRYSPDSGVAPGVVAFGRIDIAT